MRQSGFTGMKTAPKRKIKDLSEIPRMNLTIIPDSSVLLQAFAYKDSPNSDKIRRFLTGNADRMVILKKVKNECFGKTVDRRFWDKDSDGETYKARWQNRVWVLFKNRILEDPEEDFDVHLAIDSAHEGAAKMRSKHGPDGFDWMAAKHDDLCKKHPKFDKLDDEDKSRKLYLNAKADRIITAKAGSIARRLPDGYAAVLVSGDVDITHFAGVVEAASDGKLYVRTPEAMIWPRGRGHRSGRSGAGTGDRGRKPVRKRPNDPDAPAPRAARELKP